MIFRKKYQCQHTLPKHTLDTTPDIPPCTPPLRSNKCNDPLIQSCTSVIQQAAASYNNIALWRSPERTGKCCLCALTGWGGARPQGLFVQPQQRTTRGGRGEAEKGWEGCCTPAGFTFGVNKVWKPAGWRVNFGIDCKWIMNLSHDRDQKEVRELMLVCLLSMKTQFESWGVRSTKLDSFKLNCE